jgi:uncharacterized protein (TIGR00296 family)
MDKIDGEVLVGLARRSIAEYVKDRRILKAPKEDTPELREKRGVFVTIHTYPGKKLRGCIGFPEPIKPLNESVIEAAISAATCDPRFRPLGPEELAQVTIEVTVLTPPELLDIETPHECLDMIEVGRHGLIIENGLCKGLLLPQVPIEQKWSREEYLAGVCMKAGLHVGAWMEKETRLYRFEGVIFSETIPGGGVEDREI